MLYKFSLNSMSEVEASLVNQKRDYGIHIQIIIVLDFMWVLLQRTRVELNLALIGNHSILNNISTL